MPDTNKVKETEDQRAPWREPTILPPSVRRHRSPTSGTGWVTTKHESVCPCVCVCTVILTHSTRACTTERESDRDNAAHCRRPKDGRKKSQEKSLGAGRLSFSLCVLAHGVRRVCGMSVGRREQCPVKKPVFIFYFFCPNHAVFSSAVPAVLSLDAAPALYALARRRRRHHCNDRRAAVLALPTRCRQAGALDAPADRGEPLPQPMSLLKQSLIGESLP